MKSLSRIFNLNDQATRITYTFLDPTQPNLTFSPQKDIFSKSKNTSILSSSPQTNNNSGSSSLPKRYLNIFWNQHQPNYKDEAKDCFMQPWVRLHATKDYYDMVAILANYPNVHLTINLSSSLLSQLDEYVQKLHDFADIESPHRGDRRYYPFGHMDRHLDLTVKPVAEWTEEDKQFALKNFFSADYQGQISKFPGYKYLYHKHKNKQAFTLQDFRDLKVWFNLAWMDYSFRKGDVRLIGDKLDGTPMEPEEWVRSVDDLTKKGLAGGYGNAGFTEEDALNLVLDQYKIMKYVIPVHRRFQNIKCPDGYPQIEVITTPFYHPILPLIYNTDIARQSNPGMPLPHPPFMSREDAFAQVIKGAECYKKHFGHYPKGMWPGEGAVSEEIIECFQKNNIRWIATGNEVCLRSGYAGDNGLIYRIDIDRKYIDKDGPNGTTDNSDAMSIVFRSMHDKIGFDYGENIGRIDGPDAARDFLEGVKRWQHWNGVPSHIDILVTNMADGENCWTNYRNDGHDFLHALYGLLNNPQTGIITTTPSSFAEDHHIDLQWELEPLAAGSWVGGDFSTWIGEPSENAAWRLLKLTRDSLIAAGVPRPDPQKPPPDPLEDRKGYFIWKAWEAIYAAEGSDWFWWYGNDMGDNGPEDAKFSEMQRTHFVNAYLFAQKAGYDVEYPQQQRLPLDASPKTISVPPITRDPKVTIKKQNHSGLYEATFKIKAYMDKQDSSTVNKVWIDLSPLGIDKQLAMEKYKENSYKAKLPLPAYLMPGKYLLKVFASSDNETVSFDFFTLNFDPATEEYTFDQKKIVGG